LSNPLSIFLQNLIYFYGEATLEVCYFLQAAVAAFYLLEICKVGALWWMNFVAIFVFIFSKNKG